ncbi:glutathione S-transferase [Sphingomonas sp. So64.6b]|uniref:glutathione S-transferase N-terminal domain-containing protein n=1 Tax=Sphingomonas sp. So64.6b TaxID=2997354 RepID=UPI001601E31F|nr:glutathione S-transferase N-terminal domain-containing protein [Sphingomonas sp. So64.6b]QNA86201.1 glutathione S-transferase [Sphingomonas sp. So64.6b]
MILFFAPEFSSLADHIALLEAGITFELSEVDLDSKRLGDGSSYLAVNPKGQVPALRFDDGEVLTENVAILAWIADRAAHLAPAGALGNYRMLEMLSCIASEIHKRFPIYFSLPEEAREAVGDDIVRWFGYLCPRLQHGYLFGETFGVVDAYLFAMARGALAMELPLGDAYRDYVARVEARPAVQAALRRERGKAQ